MDSAQHSNTSGSPGVNAWIMLGSLMIFGDFSGASVDVVDEVVVLVVVVVVAVMRYVPSGAYTQKEKYWTPY